MLTVIFRTSALQAALLAVVAMQPENSMGDATASKQLLRNGGFEELAPNSGKPVGWRAQDWSPAAKRGTIALDVENEDVQEGAVAGRISYDGEGTNLVLYQDIACKGTATFIFRVKTKPLGDAFSYASAVAFAGQKTVLYENSPHLKDTGEWQNIELAFQTPATTEKLRIILRGNGPALFDDASLILAPGSPTDAVGDARKEPSTGKELKETKEALSASAAEADAARKAAMAPEELAWEKVLEANLGGFYLPRYKEAKAKGSTTAWDFVEDDPALPRALLIGDSISRGYTVATRQALKGKVNLHRAPANCGPTSMGLRKLDDWLGDGKWDVIHFNFGIHDRNTKPDDYVKRLEEIVERLQKTGAKLIWASSTPLSGGKYKKGSMVPMNKLAADIMAKHNIPINDLHSAATPLVDTMQASDGCHFQGSAYQVLGQKVAEQILKELGRQ